MENYQKRDAAIGTESLTAGSGGSDEGARVVRPLRWSQRWQMRQWPSARLRRHGASELSSGPVLVRLSDVKAEEVSWLWPGRVAKGKLNLLVGDPGTGKTFVALDIAARLSAGNAWPDGGVAPKTSTLVLTAEDGLADTIRPRLDALGADATEVHALEAVRESGHERAFSFDRDNPVLTQAIESTGARLVIVDPLSAYLGKGDSFKDAEVRRVLGPLARLAELAGVAILGIVHLTKDSERRAVARIQGSVGIVAAARVAVAVAKDPKSETRRLLLPIKNNLAKPAPTLAFSMDAGGCLAWEDAPVRVDVEAIMSGSGSDACGENEEASKMDVATRFLRRVLGEGSKPHEEIKRLAADEGIAERTLWRAKTELHIEAVRAGGFDDREAWDWVLPGYELAAIPSAPEPLPLADLENHGTAGEAYPQPCQPDLSCQPQSELRSALGEADAEGTAPSATTTPTSALKVKSLV